RTNFLYLNRGLCDLYCFGKIAFLRGQNCANSCQTLVRLLSDSCQTRTFTTYRESTTYNKVNFSPFLPHFSTQFSSFCKSIEYPKTSILNNKSTKSSFHKNT